MQYLYHNKETDDVEELEVSGFGDEQIEELWILDENRNDVTDKIPPHIQEDIKEKMYNLIPSDYD